MEECTPTSEKDCVVEEAWVLDLGVDILDQYWASCNSRHVLFEYALANADGLADLGLDEIIDINGRSRIWGEISKRRILYYSTGWLYLQG